MANNCTLITKEGGVVTHLLDGILRNAFLPDCVLDGCTISANGSTVSITSGAFIMGGRMIENQSTSTFTVPVTGTAACLVARINNDELTFRTDTTATPTLTQEDINVDGSTYEVLICAGTVADSALTITSKIPTFQRNGGIIYGTSATPPDGNYADGTLYIQYEE